MTAVMAPTSRPSPWALVERAQAGDAEAFAEIFREHRPGVYRFVRWRTGNQALAADLTSEAFARALARLGAVTYQGRDIGAWLTTIARNLIADHFKSARVRYEASTADMLEADQVDRYPSYQPEGVALDHDLSALMSSAIAQLTEEQQRVVRLRFYAGMSIAETAELMGINVGAVKAVQYRACRSLERILGPAGGAW